MVLHSFGQDIRLFCPHFQTKRSCLEMREEQPTTATAFQARLETKAKSRVVTRARIERWFAVPEVRGEKVQWTFARPEARLALRRGDRHFQ